MWLELGGIELGCSVDWTVITAFPGTTRSLGESSFHSRPTCARPRCTCDGHITFTQCLRGRFLEDLNCLYAGCEPRFRCRTGRHHLDGVLCFLCCLHLPQVTCARGYGSLVSAHSTLILAAQPRECPPYGHRRRCRVGMYASRPVRSANSSRKWPVQLPCAPRDSRFSLLEYKDEDCAPRDGRLGRSIACDAVGAVASDP